MLSKFVKVYIDGKLNVRPISHIKYGRPMPKLADCEIEVIFSNSEPSVIIKTVDRCACQASTTVNIIKTEGGEKNG